MPCHARRCNANRDRSVKGAYDIVGYTRRALAEPPPSVTG
jgi:hypothetical protein